MKILRERLLYWKEYLRDLSPLELPTDRPRPSVQTISRAKHTVEFDEGLTDALRGLCRMEGTTLFMTLLAAFQGLLHRYTGQNDIIVRTLLAGGDPDGAERPAGFSVNAPVIRIDTSGDPVFRELLVRVRMAVKDAHANLDVPFDKLIEELLAGQDLSCNPLFQVMFTLQNIPHSTIDMNMKPAELGNRGARFDLEVRLGETGEGLKGEIIYNTDLFDASTIERMAGHYQRMLEGAVANPEQRLSELPLLTEAERHQMLVEWNDTAADYPGDKCIHKLFEEQVKRVPDDIAVVFKDKKITYRKLNERANQLARELRAKGVRSDVVAGIMVHRSIDMISGLLGVLKAGGAYLPIDPGYPDSRIEYVLKDSGARVLLTQESLMSRLAYDGIRIALDGDSFVKGDASDLDVTGSSRDLAYVIYTSGSTGIPKGVMVEHRSVVNLSSWFNGTYELAKNRNVIQSTTFTFDVAMEEIISTLINGACLFIPEKEETLDKHKFRAFIKKNKINIAQFVPVTLREFLADAEKIDCLNIVITAGEALDERLKEQVLQKGYTLYNNYGPSETTVDVLSARCGNEKATIGKPISNTKCYILDKRSNPVPAGVAGELTIGGDGLARGYLNHPELTAEKFIPDPFSDGAGARLYRTGDLARYLPDGNIEFLGRIDNQVKVRGHRIEPDEIETLLRHHPDVRETVVIAREDRPGVKRLVAYVVYGPGAAPTTSELRRFLGEKLPGYMVPSVFVPLDSLPLTASCKVDRRALPAPDGLRPEIEETYDPPRSAIEQTIAAIWTEVLGIERIGIHDNFFDLGGDSLSASRIIARMQDAVGVDLSPVAIFEAPSVNGLARRVVQAPAPRTGLKLPPVLPRPRNQVAPLSFGQQEIWISHQLWPDVPVYNEPETIFLKGPIDPITLEKALIRLIRRHDILRTVFTTEDGIPVQAVRKEPALELQVLDMQSVSDSDREGAALQHATREARRPFNLAELPLFRALLVRFDDSDYRLYLVYHHMVIDGVSITQVLAPELWVHYEAVRKGIPSQLSELTVQFSDYAIWQRELSPEEHLAYWREQLDGLLPLDMPTARKRPPVQTFRGAFHTLGIPKALTHGLKTLGRREGCTLYMVLLAAFKVLLWRYTHQDDLAVGTVDAGRARPELDPLLGYFLNMFVVRTSPSSNLRFREFLHQVRKVALDAYVHKDLPFITLVEALKLPRDPARHPLFQVAFVMDPPFSTQESGWTISQLQVQNGTAKFDLTLEFGEREDHIIGRFEYNTDLFDTGTIKRMTGHYQRILEEIVADSGQRLSEMPLLTEAERHLVLAEWNNTDTDYPRDKCIHTLFEEQVERTPDATAVVFIDHKLTYRGLNCRANQLAHYLIKQGVGPETMVGICAERSIEMIIAMLAVLKAGGAYVPLDPAFPQERLRLMMENADISVLLTQEHLCGKIPSGGVVPVCLDSGWNIIARESEDNPINRTIRDNAAYVIYTSGSTGKPKGVLICHSNLVHSTHARLQYYRQPVKSFLLLSPFGFDSSVAGIFWTLLQGGTLFLPPAGAERDPGRLVDAIARNHISHLLALPSLYELILQQGEAERLVSLSTVIVAGEACSGEVAERHRRLLPAARFFNEYGPTEGTVWSTVYEVGLEKLESQVPIGRPIPNTRVYILDSNGQPAPINVPGELLIGGDGLARGYLNRPDLTAEKFIPDPFSERPGERLYKTGDFARYLPDGNIEFLGRIDCQVKIRGFRIELGEIEAILRQHPAVRETVVMAREDQPGDKRLVAYVTVHQGSIISTKELRNSLNEKLPEYMAASAFVILDTLPLTPSGKVDMRAFPAPESGRADLEGALVLPRTPLEEILAGIWRDVLGLKEVGVHDNFFELGGHSLLATRVMSRVHKALEIEIPLRFFFEAPTPAGLAIRIARRQAELKKNAFPVEDQAIRRRGMSGPCELSFGQERLWLYNQLEPDVPNIIPYVLRMKGHLDRYALEKALDAIVVRHEILRTTYSSGTGGPLQVVHPGRSVQMAFIDLGACPEADRQTEAQKLIDAEERHPFDLAKDLMLRATLARLSEREHILMLTMHHIASDGWSMGIFFNELFSLYGACAEGMPSLLPDLSIQYADFACWQRKWMEGEVLERQLLYWKDRLSDIPPVLELPSDRPRPAVRSMQGASHMVILPDMLVDRLKRLSKQEGVSMFTLMMAAFKTLLYRYTGQGDICVGTFIANRNRVEIESLIGFFVNTVVLRTGLSDGLGFREILQQEHEAALGAFAHQDIPFEKLLEALKPQRDQSYTPLFQVALSFEKMPEVCLELPDLSFEFLNSPPSVSLYDLTLIIEEFSRNMDLIFTYRTDIFDGPTIGRWAHNFQILLESIAGNPEQGIGTLPLLTETERRQVVVEWNETDADYPEDMCVHELLAAQARQTPDAVAVVFEDQRLTYRELNSRANQLAHYLRDQGVGTEVLAGICVDRSLDMLVGLFGILKAGGAYVPMDPAYPKERLELMLEDANISVLLTQERLSERLPAHKAKLVCLDSDWEHISRESKENPGPYATPDNAAYVIYTSGSTGRPKGVVVEHKSLANYSQAAGSRYGIKSSDRVLQFASISFDASAEEIYTCLAQGATLALRTDEMLNSVRDFFDKCEEWKLTVLSLPTAYWHMLTITADMEDLEIPSSVRLLIIGGERALPERLSQWQRIAGPQIRILNTYGPTEATVAATMFDLTYFNDNTVKNVPIGRPIPNVRTYILDPHLQPVPIGVCGELYIGGQGIARGYLDLPDMTAEKFIPDPFSKERPERLYRTGDMARYLPDGDIEYIGRIDHQVKVRGFRVEPGEIEFALRKHPAVQETVVIAQEDQLGDHRLVAYVAGNQGAVISTNELWSFLKERLPDYMLPSIFVRMDSLPMTPNGKVDRRALPAPDSERPGAEGPYTAPRTPVEEVLAGIWCEVLGLDQVGVHDNFFELGGHSLLATQVMSRLRNTFQAEVPLRRLFETPTVAGLAEAVSTNILAKEPQSASSIMPVPRESSLPLSFAQERLWFLDQLEPGSSAYNMPFVLRLTGDLNMSALEDSIGEVLRRHEALRTTFVTEDNQPVQIIAPATAFTLPQTDLSALPEAQREAEAYRLASEAASRPFDLAAGPLLRAALLRLSPQEHIFVLTIHHIAADGWSLGILYQELSVLYKAFSNGKPSPLPELPIQYADFAVWQRQRLEGQRLEKQLSFWKGNLKGASMPELALDHARPKVQTFNGAMHTLQFPRTLTEALHALSRKEGATLFMVLLAAFQTLLHRYTGQSDIVVGTPIANRNYERIEGLMGFFVNTIVMRIDTSGDPSFRELLKRVFKNSLDAYAHQDLPFEKLVENLQPERDLGRTPFFQVMFVLQNVPFTHIEMSGLEVSRMEVGETRVKFDMEIHLDETPEGMEGAFIYNTDLFNAATVRQMAGHYQKILEGIVADPEQRLSEILLLTEAERHRLLAEWNSTAADYPAGKCIHELFEQQVERTPDATAVIFGDRQLTYRQLNTRSDQLARYLIKHGAGPEVLVGICVEQSPEMVIGVLGILKAGGAYVPLDPSYPKERLAFIIEDTGSPLILVQKRLHGVLPEHDAMVVFLDSDLEEMEKESDTKPDNKTSAGNLAYVIYTSGSTGKPKGVCVPHRAVNRLVMNTNYIKFDSSDRVAQASSFSFDAATFELWGALLNGACLVGISRDVILSPEDFSHQITASGTSVMFLTTALFNQMARQMPAAFRSVRCLLFGGEAVDPACVRMVVDTGPPGQLLHVYGPTENTTFTSWCQVKDVSADARTIPIGKPVSNTTIFILDRTLRPVPIGVPGELYTGGDGLARGYLNRPELNAEKFIPNPFSEGPDARMYKTGDLARFLPDGNIEFLGRIDYQVKVRGFRIELGEIEAALGQHPAVREAVVIVREDQPGDKRLAAYVVPEKNSAATIELQGFLKKKLPGYMVPAIFVYLSALPLTVNGKVDHRALPAPDHSGTATERTYTAPRNELESQLVEIWEKVLGVHPVGITDNFFDLGGHSLLAVTLTSEIRKITGKDFPLIALFHNQTIEQLAAIIADRKWAGQWSSAVPIHVGGPKKPLFTVHDTNMTRFLETDQPLYILTHPSKDENLSPFNTVEIIASENIKEMRNVQPKGPYKIGGFCLWAIIALEMAHQLKNQGDEVSLLFMVDPSDIVCANQLLQDVKLQSQTDHHDGNLAPRQGRDKMTSLLLKTSHNIKRIIVKCITMIKISICGIYLHMGRPLPNALKNFYFPDIYVEKIMENYVPKVYPGKAVLFFSDKIFPGTNEKWNTLITGGVEVYEVPEANHLDILREPYVGIWARILNAYLEKS